MKFNVKNIEVKDLNGQVHELGVPKALGNTIYFYTRDIAWIEPSKGIYKGLEVELSEDELRYIIALVSQPQVNIITIVKDAIITYIQTLLKDK